MSLTPPCSLLIKNDHVLKKRSEAVLVIFIWAQVVVVLLATLITFGFQPFCLSSPPDCDSLMAETLVQMCTHYRSGLFTGGDLCEKMCEGGDDLPAFLVPVSCPDFFDHSGKTVVLKVKDFSKSSNSSFLSTLMILKSRTLTIEELTGKELPELLSQSSTFLSRAILDLVSDRFPENLNRDIQSVLSQTILKPLPDLSQTEFLNIWFLFLDNEFLLSSSRPADHLFPPVIGTCGHFYAVQHVHRVLDFSYFVSNVPLPFYEVCFYFLKTSNLKLLFVCLQFRSTRERLQLALDLLHFLRRFQRSTPKLELCDVKYSHFGYLEAEAAANDNDSSLPHPHHLVLLDSDMIYPMATVNQSITSVTACKSDEDCHFVDCQGECHQGSCRLNQSDTDLRRLCRNLLFMGRLWGSKYLPEFGLLAGVKGEEEEEEVEQLKKLCFEAENTNGDNSSNLDSMEAIIVRMLSRL